LVKPVDVDELKETLERYRMMHPMLPANHNSQIASLDQLSCREKEIVSYLAEGLTSREISEKLSLSKNTVDTHRRNILDKSGLRSTAELIRYWVG